VEKILQKNISDLFNVTPQTISAITKNKSNLTIEHLTVLAKEYPNVSISWLLTGEGEMYKEKTNEHTRSKDEYGFCMDCVKKDANIELLNSQKKELEQEIKSLNREIGSLGNGNGNKDKKAS